MANQPDTVDDLDARLMAIAFNAVKEAAIAKGRDAQFTDNDTKTAMTIRKILDNIMGFAVDQYQPLPLAVKDEEKINPVIDKVYNMIDKELSGDDYADIALRGLAKLEDEPAKGRPQIV